MKGISKQWTPGLEAHFELQIRRSRTFAQRNLTLLIRDLLKYDHRSRESKKRFAQARLRMLTASDRDLEEMALIISQMPAEGKTVTFTDELKDLKQMQASIRERGVKPQEL